MTASNPHRALAGAMNNSARNKMRRTTGELRMNRPPALSADSGRSVGSNRSVVGRRQTNNTTTMPANDTAFSANTSVGPDSDTSTPAIAGPIALAPFSAKLVSAAAAGICSRGTSSG